LQNAAQFFEMCLHATEEFRLPVGGNECLHHFLVTLVECRELGDIGDVAGLGLLREADELVGHSSQSRNHHDEWGFGGFHNALHGGEAFGSAHRRSPKFQYFHIRISR